MIEIKKFSFYQLTSFVLVTILLIFLNYKYDTYGVFSDKLIPYPIFDMFNLRINKFNYLEKNNNLYDSYLIGGSRAIVFKEKELNKFTNNQFFNYASIRSDMFDNLVTIKYLLKRQKVKMIILQLGVDDLYIYGENNENLLNRSHYKLIGENKYVYYFKYIFSFDLVKTISNYTSLAYFNKNKTKFVEGEFYTYTVFEQQIKENPTKYFNDQFSNTTYIRLQDYKKNKIKENIEALREIKKLTDENNTELIVLTAPLNHLLYYKIKKEDLNLYIDQIKEVTSFWNFTTINSITLDNSNYYDHSHFRYKIANMILAKIFNYKSVEVPEDFGIYIKK